MKKLKKRVFLILGLLLLISQLLPHTVLARTTQSRQVRVGFFEIEGFQETDNTDARSGYGYDYLQTIASHANWDLVYVDGLSFNECLEKLADGELDLVGALQKTDDRQEYLDYADIDSGISSAALFVKETDTRYAPEDYGHFDGIRIGSLKGNSRVATLEKFAGQAGFSYTLVFFDTQDELTASVENGETDALLMSTICSMKGYRIISRFAPSPIYFATTKGKTDILNGLNFALNAIKSANPYFDLELNKKHYDKGSQVISFTVAEMEYLRTNPTIKVAYDADWYPLEYCDAKGKFAGFMEKIFAFIKENTTLADGSGKIDFQYYAEKPFQSALDNFYEGKYHILSTISSEYPNAVLNNGRLTSTLLSSSVVVVENPKAKGTTMILPRGYYVTRLAEKIFAGDYELIYADTIDECYEALKKGAAKFTLSNSYIASGYTSKADFMAFSTTQVSGVSEDVSIAVHWDAPDELFSIIRKAVDFISVSQKNEILREVLMSNTEFTLKDWISRNPNDFFVIVSILVVMLVSVSTAIIILQRRNKKTFYKSIMYDKLTGLYVKEGFFIEFEKKIKNNPDVLYALIHFNLVQFKLINELFGYNAGDELLIYCGQLIKEFAGPDSVCARTEGDHYLICMPYSKVDMKIMTAIEEKFSEFQKSIHINTKAGVYVIDNKQLSVTAMYDRALLALKHAQKTADRKYCFYDERLKNTAVEEQEVLSEFATALMENQFIVYYQPIISLTEKRAVSAEALVRWKHPQKGIISPGIFIPILENNGLIAQLDYYVWEEVFKYARSRISRNRAPITYSVNLSRVHLYNTKFVDKLTSLSTRYDVPAELIRVEVTETAYSHDTKYFSQRLNLLKKRGFTVVMDDFGSGYSSLNVLSDFPIDVVKLDIAFFTAKERARANSIIMSTIQMLHNIGMSVVAEGVENKEQAELLYSLGCDSIQGFYFYRPMCIEDFERADNTAIEIGSAEIMKNRNKIQMDLSQLKNIENFKGMDTLVEAIPCGFGVFHFDHAAGICKSVFLSEGLESFLGYTGSQATDLSRCDIARITHPDDTEVIYEGFKKALGEKRFFEEEFRLKEKTGGYKWLSFRANAVEREEGHSLWYGVFTNIDNYRKANEELIKTSEFYKSIYDTMLCGVAQYASDNGKLVTINKTGSKIFGYKNVEDCLAKFDFKKSTHPDDDQYMYNVFKSAYDTKKPVFFKCRIIKPGGKTSRLHGAIHYINIGEKKWFQSSFIESDENPKR